MNHQVSFLLVLNIDQSANLLIINIIETGIKRNFKRITLVIQLAAFSLAWSKLLLRVFPSIATKRFFCFAKWAVQFKKQHSNWSGLILLKTLPKVS